MCSIRDVVLFCLILMFSFIFPLRDLSARQWYGERFCGYAEYVECITLDGKVRSWEELFPDPGEREIVMKVNRVNIRPRRGMVIAVPRDMNGKNIMHFSNLPHRIDPPGEKVLIWDPELLAFGAYDENGRLLRWGPAVGGKDYCPDIGRGCRTIEGEFYITHKCGKWYRSHRYPVGCEGKECARMPWSMFFHPGYALHASNDVPGRNASHGCVRLFYDDAEWLNREFVDLGTKVIIREYP